MLSTQPAGPSMTARPVFSRHSLTVRVNTSRRPLGIRMVTRLPTLIFSSMLMHLDAVVVELRKRDGGRFPLLNHEAVVRQVEGLPPLPLALGGLLAVFRLQPVEEI